MKFCYGITDIVGQIVLIKLHEIPDFIETEYFFNLVLEVSKDLKSNPGRKIVKSNQICLQSPKSQIGQFKVYSALGKGKIELNHQS